MLAQGSNGVRRTRLRTGSGIGSHRKKPIPEFRSEEEERKFWSENDSTEFIDWRIAERRNLPQLKPTLRTISLRLPVSMIEDLKILANKRDVPYQSLLKVLLAEKLRMSVVGRRDAAA